MPELKPCPFCNGDAVIIYHENGQAYMSNVYYPLKRVSVMCHVCKVQTQVYSRARKAVEKWNKRTETCCSVPMDVRDVPAKPVKSKEPRLGMGYEYYDWVCPTCGKFLAYEPNIDGIPRRCQNCGQRLMKGNKGEQE